MSSIYLLSEAKTEHCRELIRNVNKAIAAAPGMTHEAYLAFLSDKERIREALENSGIDARQEANFLAKKLQHRYFCLDFLINNEFVLFLNDSQAPGPQIISDIPGVDNLAMKMNLATSRREKAPILCEIRRILADKGLLTMDALYLPADLWEITSTNAILSIFGTNAKTQNEITESKFAKLIANTNGMQLTLTANDWKLAFTNIRNKTAYIAINNGGGGVIGTIKAGPVDESLLAQILTVVLRNAIINSNGSEISADGNITVKLSTFCKEMGIDPLYPSGNEEKKKDEEPQEQQESEEPQEDGEPKKDGKQAGSKKTDFIARMGALAKYVGIIGGKDLYSVLTPIKYEPSKDTITFAAPYIAEIITRLQNDSKYVKKKRGGDTYRLPTTAATTKATIAKERNKAASELVYRITAGLMERGSTPEDELKQNKNAKNASKKVVYTISFRSLIAMCPTLSQQLAQHANNTNAKNVYLRRAFTAAYKLIRTQTTLYKYFANLQIDESLIPTSKTLDTMLVITHEGRNAAYKEKSPLPGPSPI